MSSIDKETQKIIDLCLICMDESVGNLGLQAGEKTGFIKSEIQKIWPDRICQQCFGTGYIEGRGPYAGAEAICMKCNNYHSRGGQA